MVVLVRAFITARKMRLEWGKVGRRGHCTLEFEEPLSASLCLSLSSFLPFWCFLPKARPHT